MGSIDNAPFVEVSDVFGENDFVGPPPPSSTREAQPQANIRRASNREVSIRPPARSMTLSRPRLDGSVDYTPQHPGYSSRRATLALPSTSRAQPQTPRAQPQTPRAQSLISRARPATSRVQPTTSRVQPQASRTLPPTSHVQPPAPYVQPPAPYVQPPASHVQPPTSHVQPPTSHVQPPTSHVQPPTSHAQPQIFENPARPVHSALDDFLRQVQSLCLLLPGINLNDVLDKLATKPELLSAACQLTQPNDLLQFMISLTGPANQQAVPSQLNGVNRQRNAAPVPKAKPPPPPPPPTEDEMAKQDLEADAEQDGEFHEVETYSDYIPAKLDIGLKHPDPVVETSSLSSVEPPDVTYDLQLPSKVIDNGLLSALQLESVIYASQQHNSLMPDGTRKGFLIGDGAGVGKGRTIAGIIFENYLCGRKKSIWLSVSTDLKFDAERDLKDIGAKIPVFFLSKFPYGRRISEDHGVIFTTYSGLISKSHSVRGSLGTRMGQLISWVGANFDGIIVFDECHKAKNIATSSKTSKTQSKAAEFAVEIQKKLPKARIVYASATGASETRHLGYMTRLGIWGLGTPYKTFSDFCTSIEKRGVGGMEMVAVELKMRGSYIARQLSFKTTTFQVRIANLDQAFVSLYDECVDMWAQAFHSFTEASAYVTDKKTTRTIWTSFWAAHQKFFKYLCIGAKVPLVVEIAKEALNSDKCVVIGLQSTGEAKTLEALEDGDVSEFVSTAGATFESLVENHFPAPYSGRRRRFGASSDLSDRPASNSSSTCAASTSESSGSTIVDESWHGHQMVDFSVDEGRVRAKLKEESKASTSKKTDFGSTTRRNTRNEKVLQELVEEKRKREKKASARSLRAAKRRAAAQGNKRKSKICKQQGDSDCEEFSGSSLLSSSSPSLENESKSDESYEQSSSEEESSDTAVATDGECSNDEVVEQSVRSKENAKKREQVSDSDSDIIITAVKPKKQVVVVILSSDEDDLDEDQIDEDVNYIKQYGPRLTAMKDQLLDMLEKISPRLPKNTLDDLIDCLGGPTKVAEMTGRKGRIVKDSDGKVSYKCRNESDALDNLNIAEKERFMKGDKLIAIISEAASSGISLQADRRVANTKRRVHITIELPWSADRAIQQFGRTHRSNQLSGPEYVFIISELSGEKRFASVVAKRLESLGALTHGDRRATTENRDLHQFNLSSKFTKQALDLLCRYIDQGIAFAHIKPDYPAAKFTEDARDAFVGAGLGRRTDRYFMIEPVATQINIFLNRLLGMKVGIQNALFKLFTDYMDRLIMRKKVTGQYDAGILELNSETGKTRCKEPEVYRLKTQSGIVTCALREVQVERGVSWEEALNLLEESPYDKRSGFYISKNPLTKVELVSLIIREPISVDLFRSYKPNTGKAPKSEHFWHLTEKSQKVQPASAEKNWRRVFEVTHIQCIHQCYFNSCKRIEARLKCDVGMRHRNLCILSGGILTAWPYMERKLPEVTKKLQIVRLKLDATNRVIGPIIPLDMVEGVRKILKEGEEGVPF